MIPSPPFLTEGWYLMSVADLELELRRWRTQDDSLDASGAVALSIEQAIAYRDAGNLPDDRDRSLRLVLFARDDEEAANLSAARLLFEPDYHEAPDWRREGSRPVNLVPLRPPGAQVSEGKPWWEDPETGALEDEWRAIGAVAGLTIPGEYRGFLYKTIVELRKAGTPVTVDALVSSVARWVPPESAAEIADALRAANP